MAYTPRDWTNGEDVYDVDMDRIEQGIMEARDGLPPITAGEFRFAIGISSGSNLLLVEGVPFCTPIWLDAGSYDQSAVYVSSVGTTGAVIRQGILAMDGTVLADGGTVSSGSPAVTGTKTVTFSSALVVPVGGWFLAVAVGQGAPATHAGVSRLTSGTANTLAGPVAHGGSLTGNPNSGYQLTGGVTGALGSTLSMSGRAPTATPLQIVRRSA